MSFYVRLDPKVISRIKGWGLSPRLNREILEHIYEELAEAPTRHLVSIPNSDRGLTYSFIVRAEGSPPRDFIFDFSVLYAPDEETLILYECDHIDIEAGPP